MVSRAVVTCHYIDHFALRLACNRYAKHVTCEHKYEVKPYMYQVPDPVKTQVKYTMDFTSESGSRGLCYTVS